MELEVLTMENKNRKLAFGVENARRAYRLRLARYQALAEDIDIYMRRMNSSKKFNLLDIGLGSGRSMRYIDNICDSTKINFFGIDNSLRRLRSIYQPKRWILKQVDIEKEKIPFERHRFEIVICEQVLEHLENPQYVLLEIERILKPEGMLVIGVPTFPPGVAFARSFVLAILKRFFCTTRPHVQSFSYHSMRSLIQRSGKLKVVKIRGFRIVSGGIIGVLENYRWWYKFNRWVGRVFPYFCTELQFIAFNFRFENI